MCICLRLYIDIYADIDEKERETFVFLWPFFYYYYSVPTREEREKRFQVRSESLLAGQPLLSPLLSVGFVPLFLALIQHFLGYGRDPGSF